MRPRRLRTRFVLAGCLLVLATVVSSLWSALTFARLGAVVDGALRESQEAIDLSAELAGSLEREDDALLLALTGDPDQATDQLAAERRHGDACYERLLASAHDGAAAERAAVAALGREMAEYRAAGSALKAEAGRPGVLEAYHKRINPLLRQAVASCGKIREENFGSMREAGVRARDSARLATRVVVGVAVAAVALATVVAAWLARSVVGPVQAMIGSVEALRRGDFDRRVPQTSADELGQLAAGFNRMAETLGEYRRSSLGELLAAKTTLEATLNALPDPVLVFAPDAALVALNPPARAVLAAKRAAGAGCLRDLPLLPAHREAVETAFAGRPAVPPRTDFSQALTAVLDGRPHRFALTAVPVPEFEPRRTGAVVVLDDVTEFARLDELRSELIGVASHELKTPLTTLHMNLLMLREDTGRLAHRRDEMLTAAVQGCEELGTTIDELLDVTRVESGQLRLNLAPVDVRAVVGQVVRALRPRFEDARVRPEVAHDGGPAVVRGDAARLRIVFTNLLTNALKYSPAGGAVAVRTASGRNAEGAGPAALQIAVTDAGPGIPAELCERVFEKFFRVEHHRGADAEGVRGTGIGLYLCRQIIKAHGGSIWCEANENGPGTCVRLTLPADPV